MMAHLSLWGVIACFVFVGGSARAAAPDRKDTGNSETPAEKVRKALEQSITVEFSGHTLPAAVEALRDQSKLNIILDRVSTMQVGIEPEGLLVNMKLKNVKLRTVFKNMLAQFNLTFMIEQDVLIITTEQQAIERQVRQRVNVDFEKASLPDALKQLSRETGVNLVIDPRHVSKIKETVTLKLDDVPLEVAVRLICEVAGLRSVRQSNVLFVTSKDVAAELRREEGGHEPGSAAQYFDSIPFMGGGGGMAAPAIAPPLVQPANPAPALEKPKENATEKANEKDK